MTTQILIRMPAHEQRQLKAWTVLSGTTIQKFVYDLIPREILETHDNTRGAVSLCEQSRSVENAVPDNSYLPGPKDQK